MFEEIKVMLTPFEKLPLKITAEKAAQIGNEFRRQEQKERSYYAQEA